MRARLYEATAVTCIVTAVLDVWLARIGFDLFGLSFSLVVPIGAVLIGLAATSGGAAVVYGRHLKVAAWRDRLGLVGMALGCLAAIKILEYVGLRLSAGGGAPEVDGFWRFLDWSLTAYHFRAGPSDEYDLGTPGRYGYVLFGLQVIGLAFGSLVLFGFGRRLPLCRSCPSYVRKIRETTSGIIYPDHATRLLTAFRGSFDEMHATIAWKAPAEAARKAENTSLRYRLYECPNCRREAVVALPRVFDGLYWEDIETLAMRRDLNPGETLRPAFAATPDGAAAISASSAFRSGGIT